MPLNSIKFVSTLVAPPGSVTGECSGVRAGDNQHLQNSGRRWVSLQNKCLVRRKVGRFVLGSGSALVLLCDFSEIDALAPVQGSWCSGHSECPVVGVCSGQADEAS